MKDSILFAALMLMSVVSSSAMAEWVKVQGNENVTAYADPSTVRNRLGIAKVTSLFDFRQKNVRSDESEFFSTIRETEFNCKGNLQRMAGFSIYTGSMGRGKLLASGSEPQDWKPVSKFSIAIAMKNFACNRD